MSFSDFDASAARTKKFFNQIGLLDRLDADRRSDRPALCTGFQNAAGRPAYQELLLFKMLSTGRWHDGLSNEVVEDTVNSNLHVMRFWGLNLEDDWGERCR